MNISFECPYSGPTRPSPVQSPNDTTLENALPPTPDPVFMWTLKTSNSWSSSKSKPVQQVLGRNVWYSSPTTKRIMSTVLLTQEHIGTYTCKCTRHCSGAESHDFTVSGIEGMQLVWPMLILQFELHVYVCACYLYAIAAPHVVV